MITTLSMALFKASSLYNTYVLILMHQKSSSLMFYHLVNYNCWIIIESPNYTQIPCCNEDMARGWRTSISPMFFRCCWTFRCQLEVAFLIFDSSVFVLNFHYAFCCCPSPANVALLAMEFGKLKFDNSIWCPKYCLVCQLKKKKKIISSNNYVLI